jgi:hypothetical protein
LTPSHETIERDWSGRFHTSSSAPFLRLVMCYSRRWVWIRLGVYFGRGVFSALVGLWNGLVIGGGLEEAYSRKRYSFVGNSGTNCALLDPYRAHRTHTLTLARMGNGFKRLYLPSFSPPIQRRLVDELRVSNIRELSR